uniref:Uncharacterized protein n=1 Tax=Siphoviridae sp. ctFKD2 TaxID=2825403 RepID=A0A8S5NWH0_9CAUD|nr:MAG TPA: hypothetical protein [Siphoviridae sp. ctFKD2]
MKLNKKLFLLNSLQYHYIIVHTVIYCNLLYTL